MIPDKIFDVGFLRFQSVAELLESGVELSSNRIHALFRPVEFDMALFQQSISKLPSESL